MKSTGLNITLFLCLLIHSWLPAITNATTCSYDDDAYMKEEQSKCTESSREWICELNRCMTKANAIDTRNQLNQCASLTESAQVKACIDNLANQKSGEPDIDYSASGKEGLAQTAYGMSLGLVTIGFLSKESKAKCLSKTILTGAGLGFIAMEIYQYFLLKDKLEKYRKEYREKEIADATYNAQVDAFIYLKREQELIRDIAKKKYYIHLTLTAAFGTASAVALYEMLSPSATKCLANVPKPIASFERNQVELALLFLHDTFFPSAVGKDKFSYGGKEFKDYLPTLLGAGATTLVGLTTSLGKYFTSSAGIATVSTLAAFLSYQLANEHKKVETQANENIKKIDEALKEFTADAQQFCPDGRDDLSNPRCYCYNSDGSANHDRSASNTCQASWHNTFITATASDYANTSILGEQGCVSKDERFDPDCNCKQMINTKTGDDACLKAIPTSFNLGKLASAVNLKATEKDLNDLLKGNLKTANLNEADLTQKATRIKDAKEALLRQFNQDKKPPFGLPNDEQNKLLLREFAPKSLLNAASNGPLNKSLGEMFPINQSSGDKKLQENVENLIPKIGYKTSETKKSDVAKNDELDFNVSSSQNSRSAGEIQFEQNKDKFKFSKQDIHENKDQSLWDILSNRYNRSGLMRLFADE